jgi:3-phosphoshikimate 1-carboxyvinyltransferase
MNTRVMQTAASVKGDVSVPGSKSITNRALICAAIASGTSRITNYSDSDDTLLMINALNQLGILARPEGNDLVVEGKGGMLFAPKFPIPVGNAGTTLRFLVSLASLADGRVVFSGSERMAERPISDLLDALGTLGVTTTFDARAARYEVLGGTLNGGQAAVDTGKSSQFLSSLLLVAPYARSPVTLQRTGTLRSAPYVTMTLNVMDAFGIRLGKEVAELLTVPQARYVPASYHIEADVSGASYFAAAAAATGGEIRFPGLPENSMQGDRAIFSILRSMGCEVRQDSRGTTVRGTGPLHGVDVDMNEMPDMVPTLAVLSMFADGPTTIRNVGHLRFKESDRMAALAEELGKLGAHVSPDGDAIRIEPGPLHGGDLDSRDDHRLAMAFAVAGLRVPGISIRNPDCVRKSFPGFWKQLDRVLS